MIARLRAAFPNQIVGPAYVGITGTAIVYWYHAGWQEIVVYKHRDGLFRARVRPAGPEAWAEHPEQAAFGCIKELEG